MLIRRYISNIVCLLLMGLVWFGFFCSCSWHWMINPFVGFDAFLFSIFVLGFAMLFNLFIDFLGGWVGFEGNYAMP